MLEALNTQFKNLSDVLIDLDKNIDTYSKLNEIEYLIKEAELKELTTTKVSVLYEYVSRLEYLIINSNINANKEILNSHFNFQKTFKTIPKLKNHGEKIIFYHTYFIWVESPIIRNFKFNSLLPDYSHYHITLNNFNTSFFQRNLNTKERDEFQKNILSHYYNKLKLFLNILHLFSNVDDEYSFTSFNYTLKSLINRFVKLSIEIEQEELDKWLDGTLTLIEWLQNKVNLQGLISDWELTDEQVDSLTDTQHKLFHQCVNNIFINKFSDPFDSISTLQRKNETALRDLNLIESLSLGKLDEADIRRVESTLGFDNWKDIPIQLDFILRDKYENIANYDIHDKKSYQNAIVLLKYKDHLNNYLIQVKKAQLNANEKPINKNQQNSKIPFSFKYIGYDKTPENLSDLFKNLKELKLIYSDTSIKNFKLIFSGNQINEKVVWVGLPSDLFTFISALVKAPGKIESTNKNHWKIAVQCFIDSTGNDFDYRKIKSLKHTISKDKIIKAINLL